MIIKIDHERLIQSKIKYFFGLTHEDIIRKSIKQRSKNLFKTLKMAAVLEMLLDGKVSVQNVIYWLCHKECDVRIV